MIGLAPFLHHGDWTKGKVETETSCCLCLAIATSSELGSCASVFGSPKNVYTAAKADLNLLVTLRCLFPAALIETYT